MKFWILCLMTFFLGLSWKGHHPPMEHWPLLGTFGIATKSRAKRRSHVGRPALVLVHCTCP